MCDLILLWEQLKTGLGVLEKSCRFSISQPWNETFLRMARATFKEFYVVYFLLL